MAIVTIAVAFLTSGCLWGVVTDAETGIPLGGAKVRVLDSENQGFEATTDSNGIYVFDLESGPVPSVGPAKFAIWLWGCDTAKHWYERVIQYDDYPWVSDPQEYWEVQHLSPSCSVAPTATPVLATPTVVYVPLPLPTRTPTRPPR